MKDGWKQERHIANRVKSMLTDGGKMSRQDQVQVDGWWMTANDQTAWEPERPVGGIEINSVEPKYIKHDRWGQEWLMLNSDSGAAVTALPVAAAGDLPLEKRGEFRVASGAVIPNLGKIKMKSTDESGVAKSIRGHVTEVAKPLLSAAKISKGWDSLLSEQFWPSTGSGIVMARASDFTEKATCTTRTCELAMSHWSLHRSNQPRRAGPGWTWTMEIMMRMKRINLRSSGEF